MLTKENVEKLLNDEIEELKIEYQPMQQIEDFFKRNFNVKDLKNIETNGWQIDFWIYFRIQNKILCLYGSWFYGNYRLILE